jgi:hypothetical protein
MKEFMIDPDMRNAIYQLHRAGMPCARSAGNSSQPQHGAGDHPQQGAMPQTVRKDKIHIDPELLRRLYRECDGWIQRSTRSWWRKRRSRSAIPH